MLGLGLGLAYRRANIPAEEGGVPEWVPENAVIHIDLVGGSPQGRAWVEGTGIVAVDTLLGADVNADTGLGSATAYNAARLTANGYVHPHDPPSDIPALIGAARTLILAGSTFSCETYQPSEEEMQGSNIVLLEATDGADYLMIDIAPFDLDVVVSSGGGPITGSIDNLINVGLGARNKLAATISGSRLECAVNGSTPLSLTVDGDDRPIGNPLTAACIDVGTFALQSITLYDALPDTTGLSALSEIA